MSSTSDMWQAAKDNTWVISGKEDWDALLNRYDASKPKVTEEDWKSLDSSIYDEDQLEAFRDALDEGATIEAYDDLKEEFAVRNENNRILSEHGWSGIGASLMTSVADPTFLGLTASSVLSGNVIAGYAIGAQKLRRAGNTIKALSDAGRNVTPKARIVKSVSEAVAAEVGLAGLRNETQSDYSGLDAAIDLTAAFAIVGGMEGVSAARLSRISKTMEDGKNAVLSGKNPDDYYNHNDSSLSAAKAESDAGRLRPDDYGRFMNSGNAELKYFAENALQDPVSGGSHSAAIQAARERDHFMARQNTAFDEAFREHKKTLSNSGILSETKDQREFSEKVWETVVQGVDHGPNVSKAANAFRQINDDILKRAKESGLKGFDEIESNPQYMKQEWDLNGWTKMRTGEDALDEADISDLVYRGLNGIDEVPLSQQLDEAKLARDDHVSNSSIKRENGEADNTLKQLEDEVTDIAEYIEARKRLATGFTNRMLGAADGEVSKLDELLADPESLVQWLRAESKNSELMSEDEFLAVAKKALHTRSNKKKHVVDRAKQRIRIDSSTSVTKGTRKHSIADLMNRDAMALQQSYNHEMTGNIAFAEKLGFTSPKDWGEFKTKAAAKELEIQSVGGKPIEHDKITQKTHDLLEEMKREVFGHNRYDLSSNGNRIASVLMKYNFTTAMGKAAVSALSEFGRIMGENRVRNVLKVIPLLPKILGDSFRDVDKHVSVVTKVNAFNSSIGQEHLVRMFNSFDETGLREGAFSGGLLNQAEVVAHRGARFMAKASLLAPMDKMLRYVSFQSSLNSLRSHLIDGTKVRLAFDEMGMTKDLQWRIKSQMQLHKADLDSWGNVTDLKIEKWDRKTADEMMDALTANGNRQVQKTVAGENTAITSDPIGRIFLQFRKFAIDSYSKHLRADIRSARNGHALRVMLSNSYAVILAGIAYSARTHASTVGMNDHDSEKYLRERMASDRFAANIAAYTPSLGPAVTLWNAGPAWLFPETVIPVSRASGLDNRGVGSNPTSAAVDRAASMFHDIGNSNSASIFESGRFAIPFQNTIWGDIILNNAARLTK